MRLEKSSNDQAPELLKLDFEQFKRYRHVIQLIDSLSCNNIIEDKPIKILEVGCNVLNLLPSFLGANNISIVRCDVEDFSSVLDDFVKIEENAPLPFQDSSFDIVVAVDVIEHIKKEQRAFYVGEWTRVSRLAVIFTCPNGVKEVMDAERQVNDAYRQITGSDHPWLVEHITLGLPAEAEICDILRKQELDYLVYDNSDLAEWLPLLILQQRLSMVQGHESWLEQLNVIMNSRNNYHNPENCPYRKVYVAVKQREFLKQLPESERNKDCQESKSTYLFNPIVRLAEITRDLFKTLDFKKDCRLQLFWEENGNFCESNSVTTRLLADGTVQQYDLLLPCGVSERLRLDPANQPAFVEFEEIELYSVNQGVSLAYWSADNNFTGLIPGPGVVRLNSRETYSFFCANEDPQLFLNISVPECNKDLILRLKMSIYTGISQNVARIMESFIDSREKELSLQVSELSRLETDLAGKEKQLSVQAIELAGKEKQLSVQAIELAGKEKQLSVQAIELAGKEKQLSSQAIELASKEKQLSSQAIELSKLQVELAGKENQLNLVLNSRSWKITAPFRRLVKTTRKIKQGIKYFIPMITGTNICLKIIPTNQLQPAKLKEVGLWESLGNDPQFKLEGSFPVGWVEISWRSMSDVMLPLTLYWSEGSSMSEGQKVTIGSILPGEISLQKAVIYLSPMTKSLRLDPGDRPGNFFLSDITIIKLSRLHIFMRAIIVFFKVQGISSSSLSHLVKAAIKVFFNGGIPGIWKIAKNKIYFNVPQSHSADYEIWLKYMDLTEGKKEKILTHISELNYKPLISVVVPVYNTEERWLRQCIESVQNQLYNKWELCIADDASTRARVREVLLEYASKDPRIKTVFRENNGHISEASNSALELATGEFVALLDHDDELTPDALYENVVLLNRYPEADMIYSDEDKVDENGMRHSPFFKPDWSPDTLLSQMYTCHLGAYRTSLVRTIGGFRKGFEGSQDYDLVLRLTEKTDRIYHIPKILYHWRTIPQSTASCNTAKEYTQDSGLRAIEEAIVRRKLNAWVEPVKDIPNIYRVHHKPIGEPLISIIIPTRDMADTLDVCLSSIFEKTTYRNFEIIIVDNGSIQKTSFDVFDKWCGCEPQRIRVERIDIPFNYSRLNNLAANLARGKLLLLLNNDVEVITPEWLEEMAGQAVRPNIGAVGGMLLYPDNTIQHAGVILGIGGIAGHGHKYYESDALGYYSRLKMVTNYSAVTAACLMVRKEVFEQVNGLNEELSVAFNDIDFCLKLIKKGLYNVWLPHAQLYHYESKSRGYEDTPEKQQRFLKEINLMKELWGELLTNDPYYNPNFTLVHEDYSLGVPR